MNRKTKVVLYGLVTYISGVMVVYGCFAEGLSRFALVTGATTLMVMAGWYADVVAA